jgi:hypothetical protein
VPITHAQTTQLRGIGDIVASGSVRSIRGT